MHSHVRAYGTGPVSALVATPHRATEELGPNVVGGELRWLSATIISAADPTQTGGCYRRWHGRYVEGWEDPGTGSQALGQAVHKVAEGYLRGEGWKPHDAKALRIAMAGARYLTPHLGERLRIEHPLLTPEQVRQIVANERPTIVLTAAGGVPVAGHVDLYRRSELYVTPTGEIREDEPGTVEVLDHKTTKALKWAKTGPQLLDTVQMVLYAEYAARRWNAQHLRLSHVYYTTQGTPEALKATTCVPRDDIAKRWERIDRVAGTLVQIARVKPGGFNTVEANTGSCRAFNRPCAYANRCDAQREKYLTDFQGGSNVSDSLLDMFDDVPAPAPISAQLDLNVEIAKIEAEETAKRAEVSATPVAPAPAPTPAVDPAIVAAIATMEACSGSRVPDGVAWGFPTVTGAVAKAVADVRGLGLTAGAALAGHGKLAKLSPVGDPVAFIALARDLAAKLGIVSEVPATPVAVESGYLPPDAPASNPALAAKPVAPPVPEPASDAPAGKPVKAKRGRPAGSKIARADGTSPAPVAFEGDGFDLYIDCIPSGAFTSLDTYVSEMLAELCEDQGVIDVRCGPDTGPLAYGKWRGVIASMVRSSPPVGVCVIICDNEVKKEVAAALAPLARGGARAVQR